MRKVKKTNKWGKIKKQKKLIKKIKNKPVWRRLHRYPIKKTHLQWITRRHYYAACWRPSNTLCNTCNHSSYCSSKWFWNGDEENRVEQGRNEIPKRSRRIQWQQSTQYICTWGLCDFLPVLFKYDTPHRNNRNGMVEWYQTWQKSNSTSPLTFWAGFINSTSLYEDRILGLSLPCWVRAGTRWGREGAVRARVFGCPPSACEWPGGSHHPPCFFFT